MQIEKKEEYTLINTDENSFQDFFKNLESEINSLSNEHLIVNISENFNSNHEDILLLLNISNQQRENSCSFIIIASGIDIDEVPDEISVVPTFIEALDVLEMDEIERDLMNFEE